MDIYIPLSSLLLRYKNKAVITKGNIISGGDFVVFFNDDDEKPEDPNQLDRIVVRVEDTGQMNTIAEVISRLLFRRHNKEIDYEIIVPELLLEQEQRTKSIFNIVLGAIASISLIVGGIGIMNIMLASVLERIKEIGIRMAVGAKKRDIMLQFLCEAVAISLTGGIIGILFGIGLSYIIEKATDIHTIVSGASVAVSFFVSISVGIVFGIMPARRAALQDPIVSLRYE
jgi:putative ABC transport system permease protein